MASGDVLFLDDDLDLLFAFELFSQSNGCSVLTVSSVAAMLDIGERALRSRIAFLDIELGKDKPNGIDAFEWLLARGYKGRPIFLTGHGNDHPLVVRASRIASIELLSKPVSPETLLLRIKGVA